MQWPEGAPLPQSAPFTQSIGEERAAASRSTSLMLSFFISGISLLLPWPIRRRLLNTLCGYSIAPGAYVGRSLLACTSLCMREGAHIGHFNVIKGIEVELEQFASIGDMNWISGLSRRSRKHFRDEVDRRPALRLGRHAALTARHFIDCSNEVYIGDFSTVAGVRSQILTHAIDFKCCKQVSAPVHIGCYCFIGTACVVLKGGRLPDYSILAANSSLARDFDETFMLYSGVPASPIKPLDRELAYFHRQRGYVE